MARKSTRLVKGRVVPGGETPRDVLGALRQKLHPRHLRLSGKMRALVDCVTGERSTTPWIAEISVTSDGYVIARPADESGLLHDEFFGTADDLYKNYAGALRAAKVNFEEANLFLQLCVQRVDDYGDHLGLRILKAFVLGLLIGDATFPVDRSSDRARQKIDKIREHTVARGCSKPEAATANRIADEMEQKAKKREINRTALILCKSCGGKCGQDAQGIRYGTTRSDGSPLYPGFCSQACAARGYR